MKKDYIKSIAVLGAICLVIAALLATVNYFTAPVIKENSAAKENASLSEVLPGSKKFKAEKLPEGAESPCIGYKFRFAPLDDTAVVDNWTGTWQGPPL